LPYNAPINKKFISNPGACDADGVDHVPSPLRNVVLSAVPVPRLNVGILSSLEKGIILSRTFLSGLGKILILFVLITNLAYFCDIWSQ
jgi:hypothetical protein